MQNFRSSLILFLIVLGAIAYIALEDRHLPSTEDAALAKRNLFNFDPAQVTSLKITSNGQSVSLEKSGETWNIVAPVKTEADPHVVTQILTELEFMQSRRTLEARVLKDNNTLEKSGLNPAATTIEFSTGKKPTDAHILLLGRKIIASEYVYARNSNGSEADVHLISTYSRDAVDKKLDDLRSRTAIKFDRAKIDRLGLRVAAGPNQPAAEYEVVREKDSWMLKKPLIARAESDRVNKWLGDLEGLQVRAFVTEDGSNLNQLGLTTPAFQIWVQAGSEAAPNTLLIGSQVPGVAAQVYAKRLKNDSVFTLDQASVQSLLDGVPNARDHHLFGVNLSGVTDLQLESRGHTLAATRVGEVWHLAGPDGMRGDATMINGFLDDLSGLQATAFVNDAPSDLKPFGLDKPTVRVSLGMGNDKSERFELLLGKADKQGIYAKNSAEPFVYLLPLTTLDKWPREAADWRDRRIVDASADQIKRLTVTTANGASWSFSQATPGTLKLETPAGKTADPANLKAQLQSLADLQAVRWLGAAQPAYGLNKPFLKIEWEAGEPHSLLIGGELPSGGRAAQISGRPECFEVRDADLHRLGTAVTTESASP